MKKINPDKFHAHGFSYKTIHNKVRKMKKKPKECERCHQIKPLELANISGKYFINQNDFEWLCRKCHITGDGRMKNLWKAQKKAWKEFLKEQDKIYNQKNILGMLI